MRRDLKKILFLGSTEAHSQFFEKAQQIGKFEFVSISEKKVHQFPKGIEDLKIGMKELRKQPVVKQEWLDFSQGPSIVDRVLVLKREIENIHEEIRLLATEIVKTHPFGEFELEEFHKISEETGKHIQFFLTRHGQIATEDIPEELIHINREYNFDYYLYIGDEKFYHKKFKEVPVRMSLSGLYAERERLEELSRKSELELREIARYSDFLHDFLLREMNLINLHFVKGDVEYYLDSDIFGIEAWVPGNQMKEIDRLTSDLPIFYEEVVIESSDDIPTHLDNRGIGKVGQDLVELFDIPSVEDRDPSPWVIWAFAAFFGMIISDACYGMIFLLLSMVLWAKASKWKGAKIRLVKLLTLLSCTTIIWGVMVGSYFSIKLPPDNALNRASLLYHMAVHKVRYHIDNPDQTISEWVGDYPQIKGISDPKDILRKGTKMKEGHVRYQLMDSIFDGLLMEIALLTGIVHLSFSFLRNLYRNWSGIGWIAILWGGYLFFPKMLNSITMVFYMGWLSPETSFIVGEQLLYGGIGVAVILSIIQEGFSGLASIFKLIEVFADTLSYLRLYALGLASMVLAATANEMGMMVGGYVIGAVIIVFGHMINITLGVMAGVIHGLRLNFLEWYHHCFEGGGRKFSPLRRLVRE